MKTHGYNRLLSRRRGAPGLTFIEVVVAVAVIAILALIISPPLMCKLSEGKMASKLTEMNFARDLIEAHKAEFGNYPGDLDEVFKNSHVPSHLIYCVDDPDANAGHGNEFCTFFDWDNPGGAPPQSAPSAGYLLLTNNDLCPCKNIDYVWVSCCGMTPDPVEYGEENGVPGHPGHGPGGPGGGNGGGGGGGGGGGPGG